VALSAAELLKLQTAAATDSLVHVQLEADAVSQTLLQRFKQVQKSTNTGLSSHECSKLAVRIGELDTGNRP